MQPILALALFSSAALAAPSPDPFWPFSSPEPMICTLKNDKAAQGLCLYEARRNVPFDNAKVKKAISKEDILKSNPQIPATDTSFTQSAIYFLPCDPAKTKRGSEFRGLEFLKSQCKV